MTADAADLTIDRAAAEIARGTLSPVELTAAVLDRCARLDPELGSFTLVRAEEAMAEARRAERGLASGEYFGPLHGIPLVLKDLYDLAGHPRTASSATRKGHLARRDATVSRRLREAGAVLIGKTHCDEYAYGSTTPATRNPWNPDRVPGGSSGGCGAAIAARMGLGGMGTDTGGSVRIPAALCGIAALKPTYGLVPRTGVVPLSSSLDHAGPMARTTTDLAHLLSTVAGHDPGDPASVARPAGEYLDGPPVRTIGVPRSYFFDRCHPEVAAGVRAAVKVFEDLGCDAREVEIPYAAEAYDAGLVIIMAEASSCLGDVLRDHGGLLTERVRTALAAGEKVRAVDYLEAQRVRTRARLAWQHALDEVDVIAFPTVAAPAAEFGSDSVSYPDGTTESVIDAYARFPLAANLTGLPALSVPCGFTTDGLPIGLQLAGRAFGEAQLLLAGRQFEEATDWADRIPIAAGGTA
ncbi:Asp-tRNA(Asn)/Glu-tRNA(Gln) amidotransferase GatCAB subunit A [Amycolatopsis orientalis]|uniref:Asp-tRNA(Asn)/Glu-tRNA(Gln) amidotransferase GatCAB subunit A n=1 Tax=Amycolatopsis orientalis TaxID=31958 RepID=UPI0003A3D11D|nr:Asp-tRNA(Asn)/Glu-tRNA(Gln) amidotransferase GatCAB subunit A [Amycolatopsis orientalis]